MHFGPSVLFFPTSHITHALPLFSSSVLPELVPMILLSQHWTQPSTKILPSCVISRRPILKPPNSQAGTSQAARHPYTVYVYIPMCDPLSNRLQTFDGAEF